MCHDNAQGNIPPHDVLATRPHQRIVAALTSGVVQAQADGLSVEQVQSLAEYLRQ